MDDALTFIALAATIATGTVAALALWQGFTKLCWRHLGRRRQERGTLNGLVCGITAERVRDLLGPPLTKRQDEEADGLTITTYFLSHSIVRVIDAPHRETVAWSVTITDRKLGWSTKSATYGVVDITLAKSTFADIARSIEWYDDDRPADRQHLWGGAHHSTYEETYYFGNPGAYCTYVFQSNGGGAGVTPSDVDGALQYPKLSTSPDQILSNAEIDVLERLHSQAQPNALIVVGNDVDGLEIRIPDIVERLTIHPHERRDLRP